MIDLTYGGTFNEQHLLDYINQSGRNYIIQGQENCTLQNHPKPQSLDYWLRQFADKPDMKQADNEVVAALIATGLFTLSNNLICPTSDQRCKGLVIQ